MRRSSGINVSSSAVRNDGRSHSPGRAADSKTPVRGMSQRERFLSPGGTRDGAQDAAILQSAFSDDVKIRQGKALLKPSEIRNRTPGKKRLKDWGECPLTFDSIKEPVRAGDGNVYERWAIKKWLEENGNRSPLTNVVITPELTPLLDTEEGSVKGSRYISPDKSKESIKTEINTVLNTVRDAAGVEIDETKYVMDIPSGSQAAANSQPAAPDGGGSGGRGGAEIDPADRNKMIVALMRDQSLTPAERNAKIQAIRTGNNFAPEPEKPKPPLPPQPKPAMPVANAEREGGRQRETERDRERPTPPEANFVSSLAMHDTSRAAGTAAVPASPPSDARGAAAGAVKRAQALMASGSVSEISDVQREKQREESLAREEEDKRLGKLKSRGFSGFDPSQLGADHDQLLDLQVKTRASPRVNIDWGTVSSPEKARRPVPEEEASWERDRVRESEKDYSHPAPAPPPTAASSMPSNYSSSAANVAQPGGSMYSSAASLPGAPTPSPAQSITKPDRGGGGGGLLGWMSSSNKQTASAKQLVWLCMCLSVSVCTPTSSA
jgi:hypothetical protein